MAGGEDSSNSIPEVKEPVYPLIIFATTENTNKDAVHKGFNGEGLGVQFVANADELGQAVIKPEVFLLIVDVEFGNKRGIALQSQFKSATSAFWIALAKKLTTQQRSGLYAAGFADVLTHPVHPVLFKGRARMLLTRYLKTFDLPEYVEMPSGISRPNRGGSPTSKSGGGGGDGKSNENKGPYFGVGGSQNQGGPEWNNKIGSGKDSTSDDSAIHIKGGDSSAPDWNHHKSTSSDDPAKWNHHKSTGDDKEPAWNNHNSKSDSNESQWNNHKSQNEKSEDFQSQRINSEKQNQGPNLKIVASDKAESAWNNHSSPHTNDSPSGGHKTFSTEANTEKNIQKETANLPNSNPNSWKVEGEKKPENFGVVSGEKPVNSQIQESPFRDKKVEKEIKVQIEASLGLPASPKIKPKESAHIKEIKEKIQALKQNEEWDRKLFETSALPEGTAADICSRGLRKCMLELTDLFISAAKTLKASRITMISLKASSLAQNEILPENLYALCSSDGEIKNNERIPTAYFPQISASFEQKCAVFLNESMPDPLEGLARPQNWKINGKIEKSSAVFPIFLADQPYAVLLLQFETEKTDSDIPILEQAISFLGIPDIHYSQVDFLSRVHRRPASTIPKAA